MFEDAFEELDWFLSDFANLKVLDYWGDGAYEEAIEMIERFTEDDWQKLLGCIDQKSDLWKERLVDCLEDGSNPHQIRILDGLLRTGNDRLFVNVISSIWRHFDVKDFHIDEAIIKRIDGLLSASDSITVSELLTFKEKILAANA